MLEHATIMENRKYRNQCNSNERNGPGWFTYGLWGLKEVKGEMQKKKDVPLPKRRKYGSYIISNEPQSWREYLLDSKWLHINEEAAQKKIISCSKIIELNIEVHFCTVKGKCAHEITKKRRKI